MESVAGTTKQSFAAILYCLVVFVGFALPLAIAKRKNNREEQE
jgi:hypothetical protein